MATPTYDLIDSVTLASSASSVTFSSITQDYRDLILVGEVKGATVGVQSTFRLNSDSGSNYSYVVMRGNGSTAISASNTSDKGVITYSGSGTPTIANLFLVSFFDYSVTDKHKSVLVRSDNSSATNALANRWANTASITSIQIIDSGGNSFASGSTFYLYGVAA